MRPPVNRGRRIWDRMDDDAPLGTLLAAVARGEHAALRAIYDREGRRLFGTAMAILRD